MKNFVILLLFIVYGKDSFGAGDDFLIGRPVWFNELFGDGDFELQSKKLIQKHLSRLLYLLKVFINLYQIKNSDLIFITKKLLHSFN